MALGPIPPWIANIPTPLSAIQAGAQAGLGLGNLDLERKESVRRLMLGLAGIGQRASEAAAQTALAREQLAARTQLAQEEGRKADEALSIQRAQEERLTNTALAKEPQSKFMNVGGRLVEVSPTGDVTERFNPEALPWIKRQQYSASLDAINRLPAVMADPMNAGQRPMLRTLYDTAVQTKNDIEDEWLKTQRQSTLQPIAPPPGLGAAQPQAAKKWVRDSTGRLVPAQ